MPEWGDDPAPEAEAVIRNAYDAFNARNIDAAVALLAPDVDWPNAIEGGRVHSPEGVRDHWVRQFDHSSPKVEPRRFFVDENEMVVAEVHQVVTNLAGEVVTDKIVEHAYRLREGPIGYMEVRAAV